MDKGADHCLCPMLSTSNALLFKARDRIAQEYEEQDRLLDDIEKGVAVIASMAEDQKQVNAQSVFAYIARHPLFVLHCSQRSAGYWSA